MHSSLLFGMWHPKAGGSQLVATGPSGRAFGLFTRRHEGTEEVESWFTHTATTFYSTPRLRGILARSRRNAPLPVRCWMPRAEAARVHCVPGRWEEGRARAEYS